jgi:chemotaxis protein MotB
VSDLETKKKAAVEEDDSPTAPAWMATFADMMTLLMCFFILIMSFSTMEIEKFKLAMGSLQGALGILGSQDKPIPEQSWFSPFQPNMQTHSIMDHVEKLRALIEKNELDESVTLYLDDGEVLIQIKDTLLFDAGSAELKPNFLRLLSVIKHVLFGEAREIRVEGHTDNLPIPGGGQFRSNWELSMARSMSVVRYYVETEKVEPGMFAAAGYGEYRPIATNDTAEGRAKNRRVVIRMKL